MFNDALNHQIFEIIRKISAEKKLECYVIGGYVRDLFLNRKSKDADIVVLGDGIELATEVSQRLGKSGEITVFKNFGTAMLMNNDWQFEFVGARKESYSRNSRKPEIEKGTIADDQNRRDFTINALAISLGENDYGTLYDPFNGIQDLHDKIIRTPLEPEKTFSDDPLRMLRAVRFATQLDFAIHSETYNALSKEAERLDIISAERIADELNKIILSEKPSIGFKILFDTKLLHRFFPEMVALQGIETINGKSHKDNFYHTLQVLDQLCELSDDLWLRWAAILHDIAKPATKRFSNTEGFTFHGHEDRGARMVKGIFKRLKLPMNEKMQFVEKLVLLHLRPKALAESPQATDSGYRRLIVDAGNDADALFKLCHADITSKNKMKVEQYRGNLEQVRLTMNEVAERDNLKNWQPPVDGNDIMKTFNIKPGREIGIIKNFIRENILEGTIQNTRESALELMLTKGKEMGLKIF